jgi:Plasma-membrane choline transporter
MSYSVIHRNQYMPMNLLSPCFYYSHSTPLLCFKWQEKSLLHHDFVPNATGQRPYTDPAFAILFGVHLAFLTGLAFSYGVEALSAEGPETVTVDPTTGSEAFDESARSGNVQLLGGIFVVLVAGIFLSSCWVYLLAALGDSVIVTTVTISLLVSLIAGILMFVSGFILAGVLLLLAAAAVFTMFVLLRPYIAFASTTLKVACRAIVDMPATLIAAVSVLGMQLLASLLWMLAMLGVATNEAHTSISYDGQTYPLDQCVTYQYSKVRNECFRSRSFRLRWRLSTRRE